MQVRLINAGRLPASARRPGLIREACRAALGARRAGELNVVFLDRAEMRRVNRRYLGHGHDTDVIAFPYAGAGPEGERSLGDVLVSVHQARRQARELGHPLLVELLTLVLHGCLHLAGYDDHGAEKKRRMFARQDALLRRLLPR